MSRRRWHSRGVSRQPQAHLSPDIRRRSATGERSAAELRFGRDRLYLIGFVIIVAVLTFPSVLVLEPFGQALTSRMLG